jgi:hypothetical protein
MFASAERVNAGIPFDFAQGRLLHCGPLAFGREDTFFLCFKDESDYILTEA